jgi:hypothetical protein
MFKETGNELLQVIAFDTITSKGATGRRSTRAVKDKRGFIMNVVVAIGELVCSLESQCLERSLPKGCRLNFGGTIQR